MAFQKIVKKKVFEKPTIPEHFKFRMDIPYGYREITQSHCYRTLGHSYMHFLPKMKGKPSNNTGWNIYPDAIWVYDTTTGAIYFTNEENISIISLVLLSYPAEKQWGNGYAKG